MSVQVCGVFILCLSGVKGVLWWAFRCHPYVRWGFVIAYYSTSAACILAGVMSKTILGRALPMMALFIIRFALVGARFHLNVGDHQASWHFLASEVSALQQAQVNDPPPPPPVIQRSWQLLPDSTNEGASNIARRSEQRKMHLLICAWCHSESTTPPGSFCCCNGTPSSCLLCSACCSLGLPLE